MILSLNKKIFDFTLNTTDKIVQPILRDKTYLRMNSFQMNTLLAVQKLVEVHTSKILKGMNIPTEKALKGLYQTIYEIEFQNAALIKKVNDLERKLIELDIKLTKEFPLTPKKRAGVIKKPSIKSQSATN